MYNNNTQDIFKIFIDKYESGEFRLINNSVQQSKTIEIQNANFIVDKPWIVREPSIEYFDRELKWYLSESLNVKDMDGKVPDMWNDCSDPLGYINSNYGWCVFSKDNGYQFEHCLTRLKEDPHTREAIMIYNRPSMQEDYCKNGMHDFMCCQNVQYFINERDERQYLDCIVNFRSNDAIFGFNNDALWMMYVQTLLANRLNEETGINILTGNIYWNAGSLHIYERHFNILTSSKTKQNIDNYYNNK